MVEIIITILEQEKHSRELDNNAQMNLDDRHVSLICASFLLANAGTAWTKVRRNPRRSHSFASK